MNAAVGPDAWDLETRPFGDGTNLLSIAAVPAGPSAAPGVCPLAEALAEHAQRVEGAWIERRVKAAALLAVDSKRLRRHTLGFADSVEAGLTFLGRPQATPTVIQAADPPADPVGRTHGTGSSAEPTVVWIGIEAASRPTTTLLALRHRFPQAVFAVDARFVPYLGDLVCAYLEPACMVDEPSAEAGAVPRVVEDLASWFALRREAARRHAAILRVRSSLRPIAVGDPRVRLDAIADATFRLAATIHRLDATSAARELEVTAKRVREAWTRIPKHDGVRTPERRFVRWPTSRSTGG